HCAFWVVALQTVPVKPEPRVDTVRCATERYARELAELFPVHAHRIDRLASVALEALAPSRAGPLVPSHGDLHPKNLFLGEGGLLIAIDLDSLGSQEPAADVAYFLAQTAIMGYFHHGSFAVSERPRREFLRAYEGAAGPLSPERLGLYFGLAFLQSLHYEL